LFRFVVECAIVQSVDGNNVLITSERERERERGLFGLYVSVWLCLVTSGGRVNQLLLLFPCALLHTETLSSADSLHNVQCTCSIDVIVVIVIILSMRRLCIR